MKRAKDELEIKLENKTKLIDDLGEELEDLRKQIGEQGSSTNTSSHSNDINNHYKKLPGQGIDGIVAGARTSKAEKKRASLFTDMMQMTT